MHQQLFFWLKEILKINRYSLRFGLYFLFVMVIFAHYTISKDDTDHIINQFPNSEYTSRPDSVNSSIFPPNWKPDTIFFMQRRQTGHEFRSIIWLYQGDPILSIKNMVKFVTIQGVPYLTFILWLVNVTIIQTFRP